MKSESPISLFSFQDIITCLTGIMLVVVLVIVLELVSAMAQAAASSPRRDEIEALKKKERELTELYQKLQKSLEKATSEIPPEYAKLSLEELHMIYEAREKKNAALLEKEKELQELVKKLLANEKQLQKEQQELRKRIYQLTADEKALQAQQAELLALLKQKKETGEKIEDKRKRLRIQFAGLDDKTPVLVECLGWGFRVKKYPDGEVKVFGNKNTSAIDSPLKSAAAYVKGFALSKIYPVLLFREESINHYSKIIEAFSGRDVSVGKELLLPGEESF